eukprot:gene13410-17982_t
MPITSFERVSDHNSSSDSSDLSDDNSDNKPNDRQNDDINYDNNDIILLGNRRLSAEAVDMALLSETLSNVTNSKNNKLDEPFYVMTLTIDGLSERKTTNLKDLLNTINQEEACQIDLEFIEKMQSNMEYNTNFKRNNEVSAVIAGTPNLEEDEFDQAVSLTKLRDIRRLNFFLNTNEEKSILIRRHAVIFAMDPIRAVVMANKLVIVVPEGGGDNLLNELQKCMDVRVRAMVAYNFSAAKKNNHQQLNNTDNNPILPPLAFELHAYETFLTTVKTLETQSFENIRSRTRDILNYWTKGTLLPIELQNDVRDLKKDLSIIKNRISNYRLTLQTLVEDDEDMALMNLTLLKDNPMLYKYPLVTEIRTKHDLVE